MIFSVPIYITVNTISQIGKKSCDGQFSVKSTYREVPSCTICHQLCSSNPALNCLTKLTWKIHNFLHALAFSCGNYFTRAQITKHRASLGSICPLYGLGDEAGVHLFRFGMYICLGYFVRYFYPGMFFN